MNGPYTGNITLAPGGHTFQANYFQVRTVHQQAPEGRTNRASCHHHSISMLSELTLV